MIKIYFCATAVFCWLGCHYATSNNPDEISLQQNYTSKDTAKKVAIQLGDTLAIIAVGDIMFGTNFPNNSKLPPNDGQDLLKDFTAELKNADITFGNAEGVFLDAGGTPKGIGGNVFCFRQPVKYAKYFTDNGFNVISAANNHVADFGPIGIKSSIETYKALPINFAGVLEYPTCTFKIKNTLVGMAAFAPHKGSMQMNDLPGAVAAVKKLKQQCKVVIVSFHGGAEGRNATHVPKKTEIFFGQNRGDVYKFSHAMIDAGADVVLGHGPHVARAMEVYNNKFIAYSLGNFCTYGMFSLDGVSGIAPLLKITIDANGNFINGTITSIKQLGEGGPQRDDSNGAFHLIKNLTATDIPNNHLQFLDNNRLEKQ